ncbi:MAG: alpha/beta hydrolase [Ruminococcus sp.]|nr:alpha/beta hydrolase [Ruminococcus sp.]
MLEKMIRMQTAKQEKQLERWQKEHDAANPFPDDVSLTENVEYISDGKTYHRMDIYTQKGNTKHMPVLVNLHGGGLLLGEKEVNRLYCADMCRRGFTVFCVEYPLVPDNDIFSILRDITAAVNFVDEIASEYGGDPSRLYMCGDSAGAYLCVYLSAIQNNNDIAAAAGISPIIPQIRALGLISGMFYTCRKDKIGMFLPKMIYGKGWKNTPFYKYTDPDDPSVASSLPPCFLVTANGDFLRQYSRDFANALEKCGVTHVLLDIDGNEKLPHAFAAMLPEKAESQRANAVMAAFLLEI